MTQQALQGRKYSGDLYARKWGSKDGFIKMGNVTEFTTTQKVETDVLKSTGKYDYGQAISADIIPQPTEISLKFESFDKHALARALMGEAVDLQASPQVLTNVESVVGLGGFIKLTHNDFDETTFVVKNKSSTVINKKYYELLPDIGMLRFKDGAGVRAGETFTYSGKTKGTAGFSIDGGTLQSFELELYLDGKDRISGNNGILQVPHVKLSTDGDINWFEDGWWQSGLSGAVVKDADKPVMRFTEFVG